MNKTIVLKKYEVEIYFDDGACEIVPVFAENKADAQNKACNIISIYYTSPITKSRAVEVRA